MSNVKAGFSRLDITPPIGIPVAGYYEKRYAKGYLDRLEIQAVAIEKDDKRAIVINLDLKEELVKNYKIACEKYGVEVVELTKRTCLPNSGHPSIEGMCDIKTAILEHLSK